MELQFFERHVKGIHVFDLDGKIMGAGESASLCDRLKQLVASGEKNIILNFKKVRWINSPGIGMMLSCLTSLRRAGGDVHFVSVEGKVAFYFRITKLDTVLKVYKDEEKALEAILSPKTPS
ncbi:MAG: STAS domain-containing protein [bacterium]